MDKLGEQLPASLVPRDGQRACYLPQGPVTCLGCQLKHLAPAPASSSSFTPGTSPPSAVLRPWALPPRTQHVVLSPGSPHPTSHPSPAGHQQPDTHGPSARGGNPCPGLRGPLPATHHLLSCQRRGAADPGDTETAANKAWDRPRGSGQGRRCAPELCGPAPA